jgi:hypothetical protein
MYKIIIISFIAISAILGMTIHTFHSFSIPQTAIKTINSTATPFTKFFAESKGYQHCLENTSSCAPTVNVLYESPTTLILKSHSMNPLWKAVDKVKKSGYDIDAVTYLPNANTSNPNAPFDILVIMSQNTNTSQQK